MPLPLHPTPLVDGDGTLVGSVSLWTDITARKQAEDQLRVTTENLARKTRELELTLDSIEQGIVSMDAHGKVEVYNRQVLQLLDLPEHLLGPDSTHDDVVRFQASKGTCRPTTDSSMSRTGQRRYFQGAAAMPRRSTCAGSPTAAPSRCAPARCPEVAWCAPSPT